MDGDLTLIIITDERHPFLRRILDYYLDAEVPILVADSSREERHMPSQMGTITSLESTCQC